RFDVLVAGSVVHFIIAIVLLFLVIATIGDILDAQPTLTISGVSTCIPRDPNATSCTATDPHAPAAGKLQAGDRIVAVNGRPVSSYDAMRAQISASPGHPIGLTLLRHRQQVDVT